MTVAEINQAVYMAFRAMYPTSNVTVRGAGTEEILVSVQHGTTTITHWICELSSDDDGQFHFTLDGCDAEILVPYPGE